MTLRDVSRAVRAADIAALPLPDACRVLADLPAAKEYDVTPALLWRAAHNALPREQAEELIQKAGVRGRIRLADLAYLARYDMVLRQVVAAIVFLMEEHR